MPTLGRTIAAYRTLRGLQQEEFARRIYVSQSMISLWEADLRQPAREHIAKMAEVLNVPISVFHQPKEGLLVSPIDFTP